MGDDFVVLLAGEGEGELLRVVVGREGEVRLLRRSALAADPPTLLCKVFVIPIVIRVVVVVVGLCWLLWHGVWWLLLRLLVGVDNGLRPLPTPLLLLLHTVRVGMRVMAGRCRRDWRWGQLVDTPVGGRLLCEGRGRHIAAIRRRVRLLLRLCLLGRAGVRVVGVVRVHHREVPRGRGGRGMLLLR